MSHTKESLITEVNAVLYKDWAPIVVEDLPQDEYKDYAIDIVAMLGAGATEDDISEYLDHVESNVICCGNGSASFKEIAAKLMSFSERAREAYGYAEVESETSKKRRRRKRDPFSIRGGGTMKSVWIFSGLGGRFPSAAFEIKEAAEAWINQHELYGTLTRYPLNIGVYEWAITGKEWTPKWEYQKKAEFIGNFSAYMEHYHYQRDED